MRYNLESTLPINAFSPRGKGPFSIGMTLEGGGGGFIGKVLGGGGGGGTLGPISAAATPAATPTSGNGFGNVASAVSNAMNPAAIQAANPNLGGTLYPNNPTPSGVGSMLYANNPTMGYTGFKSGGQVHGLKSIAQDLSKYGRNGDTMVAHINPQEAGILKSLGGSGTINPHTGLPEFGFFKSIIKPFQQAVAAVNPFNPGSVVGNAIKQIPGVSAAQNAATAVFQPIEKAIVQPASAALANLDKAVGKAIPGGWGTVAAVAGSAIGLPTAAMIGLGALNGSGVTHKGGSFNLQGAIMGGAMAYGMSELGNYARAAVPDVPTVDQFGNLTTPVPDVTPQFGSIEEALPNNYAPVPEPTGYTAGANGTMQPTFDASAPLTEPQVPTPTASAPYEAPPFDPNYDPNAGIRQPISSSLARGEIGDALQTVGSDIGKAASNIGTSISEGVQSAYDTVTNPQTYSDLGTKASNYTDARLADLNQTGAGIKNILTGTADPAAAAAVKAGTIMSPALAGGMTIYGGMSLAALDEQRKYLSDQAAAGALSNAEYNAELAKIDAETSVAKQAVAANPLQSSADISNVSEGPSLYNKGYKGFDTLYSKEATGGARLYATGGNVQMNPPDDQTGMMNQSPMTNFGQPGIMSMVDRTVPQQTFAAGGMPRFLSGGGDGMSDSIPASINDSQEARLADGEFVIPADVVSHLGNGSSKAGAKQLYSMMDKVRQARTGTKKQGKQINPRKYLTA